MFQFCYGLEDIEYDAKSGSLAARPNALETVLFLPRDAPIAPDLP